MKTAAVLGLALWVTPAMAHAGGPVRQFTVVASECAGSSATFGRSQTVASLSKPAYVCTAGEGRAVCYHTWTEDLQSKPNGGLSEAMVFDVAVTHKNAVTLTHPRHTLFVVAGKKDALGYALISTWSLATEQSGETSLTARTCSGVVKEGATAQPNAAAKGHDTPKEAYDGVVLTAVDKKIFAVDTTAGLITVSARDACDDVAEGDALIFMDTLAGCKENTFVNRRTGRLCLVTCKEAAPVEKTPAPPPPSPKKKKGK